MPHYVVSYDDEGRYVDRDAWWYRVSLGRDGEYLGKWVGRVSGLDAMKIPETVDVNGLHRGATFVTAHRIRDAVFAGELRQEWALEIEAFDLAMPDLEATAAIRSAEWRPREVVLEFDTQ